MHTVWIGAAGTATGYGIARSLRTHWGDRVRLVTADINPAHLVAASELADAHVVVPPVAQADRLARALRDGFEAHGVDTYFPLLVAEIVLAAGLAEALGVSLVGPGAAAAALCADKLEAARWMEAHGIPAPPTVSAAEARWWPEGVVVKPRSGQGSHGVETIAAEAELGRARERGEDAVAQRRCRPPEITVDAFASRDGALFRSVCRERLEVKAGVCTKARLFEDAELADVVRTIAGELGHAGVLCVQAMRGPDGYEVTDLNPRPGAGTPMSALAGVDVTAAALADLWGEDPEPFLGRFEGEPFVVRRYEEILRYPA
ncbi:MAG: carbamoyl-phosphate synthase large subunit [Thermoleophilaceae bacterium]|jgi:carbamoylphosphate synthase large subunit|nr:carbamoyl-phosphate synthase large subunit [Thermoleophilaceae bacterium]